MENVSNPKLIYLKNCDKFFHQAIMPKKWYNKKIFKANNLFPGNQIEQ
jgi:hypothetical protein